MHEVISYNNHATYKVEFSLMEARSGNKCNHCMYDDTNRAKTSAESIPAYVCVCLKMLGRQ